MCNFGTKFHKKVGEISEKTRRIVRDGRQNLPAEEDFFLISSIYFLPACEKKKKMCRKKKGATM